MAEVGLALLNSFVWAVMLISVAHGIVGIAAGIRNWRESRRIRRIVERARRDDEGGE